MSNKRGGLKKVRRKITKLEEIIKTSKKLENNTEITNVFQIFIHANTNLNTTNLQFRKSGNDIPTKFVIFSIDV